MMGSARTSVSTVTLSLAVAAFLATTGSTAVRATSRESHTAEHAEHITTVPSAQRARLQSGMPATGGIRPDGVDPQLDCALR